MVFANFIEFVVAQFPVIESPASVFESEELRFSTQDEYDTDAINSASFAQRPTSQKPCRSPSLFDEISFLFAIDGSKQPHDFGVNANLGGNASVNWGIPVFKEFGIGAQFGTGITASASAVRVFELLGESTGRTQSYTTLGMFQRTESGFSWGFAHDFLYQKSYDSFRLGQMELFQTDAGRVITGLIVDESDKALTIQTANERLVLPKSEIENRTLSKVSMMPDGLLRLRS